VTASVYPVAHPGELELNLADPQQIGEVFDSAQPAWILIAGAFCHVDLCETKRKNCFNVNVAGPKRCAELARQTGATVVYYSTDHVFDGTKERYSESDAVQPLNTYAESKVAGEEALRAALPEGHLILRTSWLYGPDPARKNFPIRFTDRLRAGEKVPVPSDQWGSPTYTEDLARVTRFLLEKGARGTFHATGPDFLSRGTLAARICKSYHLDALQATFVETDQLQQPAKRPLRIRLNTDKLAAIGAPPLRGVTEGLKSLRPVALEAAQS